MRYTFKQFQAEYPNDESCLDKILEMRYGGKDFTCPACNRARNKSKAATAKPTGSLGLFRNRIRLSFRHSARLRARDSATALRSLAGDVKLVTDNGKTSFLIYTPVS